MEPRKRITWGEPAPDRAVSGTFRTVDLDDGIDLGDLDLDAPSEPLPPEPELPEVVATRYERRELLGRGGMGEVWRYWDQRLRRPVALKILRRDLVDARTLSRFEEEAQVSAQLQHPGIIPVHDLGVLEDGRLWFTMKEVRGRTLEEVLTQVHRAWRMGMDEAQGMSFRRMLEAFLRVCETVAYAHARSVVHRDIKPSNIMVGDYGEVLVLDWGLAKALGAEERPAPAEDDGEGPIDLQLEQSASRTRAGSVVGTPAYMAPEQARGENDTIGPTADVYALGATLYDLLAERPPRLGKSAREVLMRVAVGDAILPPSAVADGPRIDVELDQICLKALHNDIDQRYADAGGLAAALAEWLDGARKRERAMALVVQADAQLAHANDAGRVARQRDQDAARAMQGVPDNAPAEDKAAAWALEDQARQARGEANDARTRAVQLLRAALSHAPELPEAHERLARHYRWEHKQLEEDGETLRAATALAHLREHDTGRRYASYIAGDGAITLVTDPPGATVGLHRFVEQGRRLVPVFERELGTTPLEKEAVAMGNYLLTLHKEGHDEVRYPVWIRREEHWDGIPPGESEPFPIRMPGVGELGEDDCYVPAGWFWTGDDELEAMPDLERQWCEAFVIKRFPVTTGEYVAFLNDLLAQGREAEALEAQPIADDGEPWLERGEDGRWIGVRGDSDDPRMEIIRSSPRMPIVFVTLTQAADYARWVRVVSGQPWAIPGEHQWLHAGRGADPRVYPWGNHFELGWARAMKSAQRVHIVSVDDYPTDVAVYGVRGLAGNVSEWALRATAGAVRFGGGCGGGPITNRLTFCLEQRTGARAGRRGFRLARRFL